MSRRIAFISLALFLMASTAIGQTKVTWWQFWTDPNIRPTIQAIVDEFEKQNPDIEVELTDLTWSNGHEKIVIAFSTGRGPDVVELGSDWIAQFAESGHLADLGEFVSSDSADFQGWGMATYNEKIYARPWFLGTRVMYVNRTLLTRAGYDNDFVPYTLDHFKEVAYKIDSLSNKIYGFGSNTAEKHRLYKKFLPFFWSMDAQLFTDDGKYCIISSVQAVDALIYYKELHDSTGYVGTQRQIEDAFLDGKIGFVQSGDWLLKRIELEKRNIDFVITNVPGLKYPGYSFKGGEFLAVNANSENKVAAKKLIRFITSPENQIKFCKANYSANPSSKEAQKDPYFAENENLQAFIRQIRLAVHPPVDPDWVHIENIIEEAIEDALFGQGLPATALRDAQIKITNLKKK